MPSCHIMMSDGVGISMINTGVGSPNALTISDIIAPKRSHGCKRRPSKDTSGPKRISIKKRKILVNQEVPKVFIVSRSCFPVIVS